jgi:DNA repair protein RecO (recombination protein O)
VIPNYQRVPLGPAFLLHRKPWRDTSLLIEAFTPQHGRVGLVARGVRGKRSAKQAILQPFQPLLLNWSGRGELFTLNTVEASAAPLMLQGLALVSGFYVNELLLRLLQRHDPHEELFQHYQEVLWQLHRGEQIEWSLRLFERALLDELGYGLLLDCRADSGESLDEQSVYHYLPEQGPMPEGSGGGLILHGMSLLALASGVCPSGEEGERVRREVKQLMRSTLARYLGSKPLASRALFQAAHGK